MALAQCRECGKGFSTEAPACPRCGAPARLAIHPPTAVGSRPANTPGSIFRKPSPPSPPAQSTSPPQVTTPATRAGTPAPAENEHSPFRKPTPQPSERQAQERLLVTPSRESESLMGRLGNLAGRYKLVALGLALMLLLVAVFIIGSRISSKEITPSPTAVQQNPTTTRPSKWVLWKLIGYKDFAGWSPVVAQDGFNDEEACNKAKTIEVGELRSRQTSPAPLLEDGAIFMTTNPPRIEVFRCVQAGANPTR